MAHQGGGKNVKLASVEISGRVRVALVEDGKAARLLPESAGSLLEIVERGASVAALAKEAVPISGTAKLLAPIARPRRNIFCVGKNYHEHAHEFARSGFDSSAASGAVPEAPIVFSKVPDCVIGPDDAVAFDPTVSTAIDYEGELAVIIGKAGRKISRAAAMDHVWGYTIVNDVTARDVQGRLKQWLVGKSFDTFCPMGPWVVTADEIDLGNTTLKTWVNGELRQNANTRDLIFDVPTIIETISAGVSMRVGDIIATGTPVGVGIGFTPPKYLRAGDRVEIEISGIGRLANPIKTI